MNIQITIFLIGSVLLIAACSQPPDPSSQNMVYAKSNEEEMISKILNDHHLSEWYLDKMMQNEHTTGMVIDHLVKAAAKDSTVAQKMSAMITKYPELMLMTVHHFMPVINSSAAMCDSFCDQMIDHQQLSETMCGKMIERDTMTCCN